MTNVNPTVIHLKLAEILPFSCPVPTRIRSFERGRFMEAIMRHQTTNQDPESAWGKWAGRTAPAILEHLELRRLMSASLSAEGILTVIGSEGNDWIQIYLAQGNPNEIGVSIHRNYSWVESKSFSTAQVKGIVVEGLAGNDDIGVLKYIDRGGPPLTSSATNLTFDIPVTLRGGDGDDFMMADGDGDNVILGQGGYDWYGKYGYGNDLMSVEWLEDYRGHSLDESNGFYPIFRWNDVGDQVYTDPWIDVIRDGQYYGADIPEGHDPETHTWIDEQADNPTEEVSTSDAAGDTPIEPADDAASELVAQPASAPLPAPFSTTPVFSPAKAIWDDGLSD